MKITASQLRRIIKEEVKRAKRVNLSEGNPDLAGIIEMNVSEEGPAIENIVFNTLRELGIQTEMVDDELAMQLVETINEKLIGVILSAFQDHGM